MKRLVLLSILIILAAAGCGEKTEYTQTGTSTGQAAAEAKPAQAASNPNAWQGKVLETMNSGGYTYVYLDTGSEKIWAAGPETTVKVGQEIIMDKGMPMSNFHSKTLDRDFSVIYFVGAIEDTDHKHTAGEADHPKADHPKSDHPTSEKPKSTMPTTEETGVNPRTVLNSANVAGVEKAASGYTVEEIFTRKGELKGKPVKVRARVVKFTANIMGTNWVHLQDGTGTGATGDLTVTTSDVVATGDLVLVEGSLTVDKDFGAGYRYAAIIEDAKITKE